MQEKSYVVRVGMRVAGEGGVSAVRAHGRGGRAPQRHSALHVRLDRRRQQLCMHTTTQIPLPTIF